MKNLNFEVAPEVQARYKILAGERKVPVSNLYAAVLAEALDLGTAATVPCAGRKPRAPETKPRQKRKIVEFSGTMAAAGAPAVA